MKKAIIPIPDKDFDTTEVSITWKILKENKIDITFATENGIVGETDPLLLTGVIFGQLGAKKDTTTWWTLPYSETSAHIQVAYSVGYVRICSNVALGGVGSGALKFRVVLLTPAKRMANPRVNFNNYSEVKKAFNLKD